MKLQLDLSKEYGIVLEGGGAKGAYQVGAWEAIKSGYGRPCGSWISRSRRWRAPRWAL